MTLFDSWLDQTRKLQAEAYGIDYDRFSTDADQPENVRSLVDYISWNTKAAMHELVELDSETSWKPWQHDDPYVHRREVIKEAIDVLHFVGNVLAAVDCTDQELSDLYREKMEVNRHRQLGDDGYRVLDSGVKCQICKRALDDVTPSADDASVCERCATAVFQES